MHAKFVTFPLEPMGFILAFSSDGFVWGMALPFFIAWVAKTIILRVGGSKAYEDSGVPAAGGVVVGTMAVSLFRGAMMILRYFYPY
jgi:hypothetical protein